MRLPFREEFIRTGEESEPALRVPIPRVPIRMAVHRLTPVHPSDLREIRILGYVQNPPGSTLHLSEMLDILLKIVFGHRLRL